MDEQVPRPFVLSALRSLRLYHIASILIAIVAAQIIYSILFHPLRNVPGPFFAKFTELWRTSRYLAGNWHYDICELHRKYGPVVRLSPNEVSFVDKEALTKLYGHSTGTKKTAWYHVWDVPGASTGFFAATDVKEHSFLRKRVATAYTMSTVLKLEPQLQTTLNAVWKKFRDFAREGTEIDVQEWTGFFAFDIVTKLGLGSPLGFVEAGKDVSSIIKSIQSFFYINAGMGYMPGQARWLQNPVFQSIMKYVGPKGIQGQSYFFDWLLRQVTSRMAESDAGNPKNRDKDMLDHFISMKEPDGSPVPLPGVLIEGGNLIGAGADTAAIGVAVVLGAIIKHKDHYNRVQREVDEAFTKNGISDPADLSYLMAEKIAFLDACIKEATRLCPSILWQLPREAPAQGISIAGHYIPPSATVSMSPVAQNRCKEIFGDDADEWKPERFVAGEKGATAERIREMDKYSVTFGFGSRTCVGKNLATVELYKFVGQFVRQFDCDFVDEVTPFVRRSQWFCLQEKMLVKLRERITE